MTIRIGLLAATGALALTAAQAHAQAAQGLELGVEGYTYRYDEAFEDIRVEDEGRFVGASIEYGRTFGAWKFDAKLRFASGSVDYSASDGATLEDVDQYEGQLEFLLGRRFARPEAVIMPYVGIGARTLDDRSGGLVTDTGLQGYDREIVYSYMPFGAAAIFERGPGRSLSFYGQYNWLLEGESRSDFDELDPQLPAVEVRFESGHGWEFGAKLTAPLGSGTFGIQPFIRTWDLDQSTSFIVEEEDFIIELFEPPNQTREFGLRFTYGF